jgi:hypothetical protein
MCDKTYLVRVHLLVLLRNLNTDLCFLSAQQYFSLYNMFCVAVNVQLMFVM